MRLLFATVLLILTIEANANKKACFKTKAACKALGGIGLHNDEACDGREISHSKFHSIHHHCKCCFSETCGSSTNCPEGFFHVPGYSRCYKFFNDEERTWFDANQKCTDENLVLAMTDNNEVALRNYITDHYRTKYYTWLGAKSDGSSVVWEQTGEALPDYNDSESWYMHNTHSGYCLTLMTTYHYAANKNPTQPFYSEYCYDIGYTLCEVQV